MKIYKGTNRDGSFGDLVCEIKTVAELNKVENSCIASYEDGLVFAGHLIDKQNNKGFVSVRHIKNIVDNNNAVREARLELKSNLYKFVEIARSNKASFSSLVRYHNTIFSGRPADFESKWWVSAEKTIAEFNEYQFGKPCNFADFNFLRHNKSEIAAAL